MCFGEPTESSGGRSSRDCWQTGAATGPHGAQDTCSGKKLCWQDHHREQPVGELGESRATAGNQAGTDLSTGTGVQQLFECSKLYILIYIVVVT